MLFFKKILFLSVLFCYASASVCLSATLPNSNPRSVEFSGLDCVGDYNKVLSYLGRGEDFPAFLVSDVNTALLKQSAASILTKVECTSGVKVETVTLPDSSSNNRVLSELRLTFPLIVHVENGNETYQLVVEQHYNATHLETTDKRKSTYVFEVLKQSMITK